MRNEVRTMKKRLTVMISMLCILMNFSGCRETLERDETETYAQEFQNPDGDTKKNPTPTVRPTPTEEIEESVKMVPKVTQTPVGETSEELAEVTKEVEEPEEPVIQPAKEEKTAEGYILDRSDNVLYLDLENTGSRNYPGEGKDRAVIFDISNAEIILTNPGQDVPNFNPTNVSCTVSVTYYTEDGCNIATAVSGDGCEQGMVTYVSTGTIIDWEGNLVTLELTEGDYAGTTETFDMADAYVSGELTSGSVAGVTYYIKESDRIAASLSVGGYEKEAQ